MFDANILRVMIASPSDMLDARDTVERAVAAWNTKHAESARVVLLPWRWETASIPDLSAPAQALLNKQGVDQADIVIALFGSRLGAPTQDAVSGTVEEIQRARSRDIPVHLYFSTAPIPNDADLDQVIGLRKFKADVQALGLYAQFNGLDQLAQDVDRALSYDVSQEKRKADSYFDVDVDRTYELFETRWTFSRSANSKTLRGRQEIRRHLISRNEHGLDRFNISLSRETDKQIGFSKENTPEYEMLEDSWRSDGGALRLLPPHKSNGGSFEQSIVFEPPLDSGSSARLHVVGNVSNHKYATLEQFEPSTRGSKLGLRDWDYVAITINYPIARLIYSAFFPDELAVHVLGVRTGRGGGVYDVAESAKLRNEGYVSQKRVTQEGVEGTQLTLDMPRPRLKWTYRLCWRPPSEVHAT